MDQGMEVPICYKDQGDYYTIYDIDYCYESVRDQRRKEKDKIRKDFSTYLSSDILSSSTHPRGMEWLASDGTPTAPLCNSLLTKGLHRGFLVLVFRAINPLFVAEYSSNTSKELLVY